MIEVEGGEHRESSWEVLLKGSLLRWRERETVDRPGMRIDFKQLEGDLDRFDGHWLVEPAEGGSDVELHVEFEIGIPLLAEMLNPVAARALRDNSADMLSSLEAELAAG